MCWRWISLVMVSEVLRCRESCNCPCSENSTSTIIHSRGNKSLNRLVKVILEHVYLKVRRKIAEIQGDSVKINLDHENHTLFSYEHDQQLLLWMNRYLNKLIDYILISLLFIDYFI